MKKAVNILLLVAMSLIAPACSTCKVSTQNHIKEILFGHGGGVTNQEVTFVLTKNGKLYQGKKLLKKINCEDVEQIFSKASNMNAAEINEYGNTYWFVEFIGKNNKKYVWTGSSKVSPELKSLFETLNNTKIQ